MLRRLALIAALSWTASASADQPRDWFAKGADNLAQGRPHRADFARAADLLAQTPNPSARDFFNLGNAAYLAGRLADAIAAYRHALELNADFPNLRANLALARREVAIPAGSKLKRANDDDRLAVEWIARGGCIAFATACFLGFLGWRRRSRRPLLLGGGCFVAAVVLTVLSLTSRGESEVLVVRESVPLRIGNGASYAVHPDAPVVPVGLEVRVLHKRGTWSRVECPGGVQGWIQ